jgi:hypothetical protein
MEQTILRNEKGVALVVALVILLVLTLIGFNSINTTTFEANISGNERVGIDAFYASEAGNQHGLDQLPGLDSIPRTRLGEDSYYWSGGGEDKGNPKPLKSYGMHRKPGYEVGWAFKRYQVHVTGESFAATKETETQVSYGPFPAGTDY